MGKPYDFQAYSRNMAHYIIDARQVCILVPLLNEDKLNEPLNF